ncbi:MAG: DUF1653 domain-containing protein [Muribaculum sp.]|nr:DUF1653 domain-containing protein [Muribaculum sp.]
MAFIPIPHEIYKHFKGNLYQITAVARHTETEELLVVYQALYGDFQTYARPLEMFLSEVDREKYPDVRQKYRFELQSENADRQREREQDSAGSRTAKKSADGQAEAADGAQECAKPAEQTCTEAEELNLDPQVLAFLDADSYEERLNLLAGLHHRITDEMITTMAVACDVEVPEGDTESRYVSLRSCLLTLEKYECNRLR